MEDVPSHNGFENVVDPVPFTDTTNPTTPITTSAAYFRKVKIFCARLADTAEKQFKSVKEIHNKTAINFTKTTPKISTKLER